MSSPPPDVHETVRVTALASDGDGIARTSGGRVVFVEGGVPGDRVELSVPRKQKGSLRARIARIVEASPDRVDPRCSHFGECGGCQWQHVAYAAQLEAKRKNVRAALERIGGLALDRDVEIIASPADYRYRARTRIVEVEGGVGYRRRGSNETLRVDACPVLVPEVESALLAHAKHVGASQQRMRRAGQGGGGGRGDPRARESREWVITAGSRGPARVEGVETAPRASEGTKPTSGAGRREEIVLEALGEQLRVGGPGFIQGNALLWDRLAREVRDRCLMPNAGHSPRRFVELYAGIGFFTLPLARRGLTGLAVESDHQAVSDLVFNLDRAGLSDTVEVISAQVELRSDLSNWLASADLLLVDPPRVGLEAGVREAIAKVGPRTLVYVSCDPATLARDLKLLVAHDYRVASVLAFDLFPHTPHVETVVRLER